MEAGDTALSVSKRFNIPVCTLIKLNNLKKEITAGDLLYLENADKIYHVQLFDTLLSVAEKFKISGQEIKEKNGIEYIYYGQEIIV